MVFNLSEIENEKKMEEQRVRLENVIEGTRLGTWEWNVLTDETPAMIIAGQ